MMVATDKRYTFLSMKERDGQRSPVREWVMSLDPGTYFTTSDVPCRATAVGPALTRLSRPDGPIERVRQGVYWRKVQPTRFGSVRPDAYRIALLAAGEGAGPSGASAANRIGLSTQVPKRPHVAVVGRPPKGLDGVKVVSRANPHRVKLSSEEIAVLECLRDFDRYSEVSWNRGRQRIRHLAATGKIDLQKIAEVAAHERCAGLSGRISDLLDS
jgi:hypothetical protein